MTRNQLKYLAYITMFIDHAGHVLFPDNLWLRMIGRLAAPIFFYFAAMSVFDTKNRIKYVLRLAIFALISEPLFNQMVSGQWSYLSYQNVYFTILLGVLACLCIQWFRKMIEARAKELGWMAVLVAAPFIVMGMTFNVDYRAAGVLMIVLFFSIREYRLPEDNGNGVAIMTSLIVAFIQKTSFIQAFCLFVWPMLPPKPSEKRMSKLWYFFYPAHIGLLLLIKIFA